MKSFITTVSLFLTASTSFAIAQSSICPDGTYPQCCAPDVLNPSSSDCGAPPQQPSSSADLVTICGDAGQEASCCSAPVYDQGVVCAPVVGV
ncbi:hypothetical protein ASPTUDRAFT_191818 [Aspergillus tubingensis CBS 134.48]|uniref:Hydrophobin n=1 Tax=Aspergillus tubingensis (strain CBS 134.48) TaxID=767770 RepID=A0A1L9N254_ASPTC|nr:hypothetical protein ASPTUDRAFT_191818 [Aspergillus tubingensis CBS 134.48]